MNVWYLWCDKQGVKVIIEEMSVCRMNSLLSHFVQEATRKDRKPYPFSSIYNIICAIQHYLCENGRPEISFSDEKASEFNFLHNLWMLG